MKKTRPGPIGTLLCLLAAGVGLPGAGGAASPARPIIRGIAARPASGVQLWLTPVGVSNEVLEIYTTDSLAPPRWRVGAPYMFVEGRPELAWHDPDTQADHGPDLRFYRLGRAEVDANENGIPDAREMLFHVHDLAPTSRARWARAGRAGPFPAFTNIVNVKNHGAKGNGTADDTAAFTAALGQAPSGSVVYVPAGSYKLTQPIYLKSHVVLRGDGPLLSSLLFSGSGTAGRGVGILRWDSQQTSAWVAVTGGMAFGSTEVAVSNVTGLAAGDVIEIEEDNDPSWGFTESWQDRLPGQLNRVTAVDTARRRLALDRPLRHSFTAARRPRLRKLHMIENAGVEKLFLQRLDARDGHTIEMKYAVRCFVRQVESFKTYKAHVWIERGYECEVRDSYFHDSFAFAGGQGYGVGCARHTSDTLVENNVFRHLRHSMSVGIGANGNVFGYNFSTNRALDPALGTPQADLSVHGNYVFMNLFEGNLLEDADVPDWYFPAGPGNTLFRNRIVNCGTAIEVASARQNFLGNDLPAGRINRTTAAQNLLEYGNRQADGVSWEGCPCRTLPDSLYRAVPPDFLRNNGTAWPPIGPDTATAPVSLPAQQRYLAGACVP